MGDGMKPKEILDSKGTNVRFDFALRLANELEIDVKEICSASPFSGAITEEEIYPTLSNRLNDAIDGNWVKTYLKNSMYPLMYLFEKTVCRIWIIC